MTARAPITQRLGNAVSALLSNTRLGLAFDVFTNRYDAAQWSTERSQRRAELQSARVDVSKCTREWLQAKSLDFDQNSELFNKLADIWEQYTVGSGLQFFPTTSNAEWNKIAADTWEAWKPFADVSSRFGFDSQQGVISRSTFVFGGVFVLLTRDPANNRPRIQTIEAHFCKTPPQFAALEKKTFFDGVECDPRTGRIVRYWFEVDTNDYRPFESWQVVHIFESSRPNQVRELPYIACATNTLTDMLDLAALEMKHCKVNAENSLNVYTQNGELPPAMRAGAVMAKFNSAASTNNGTATIEQRTEYYRNVYAGGRVNVAYHGDKIEEHVSNRPTVAAMEYWKSLAERVCAGVGIPYVLVYPESMQGTVYRGALDAAAAFFRIKSAMFAMHFQRIYEYVINAEASFNPRLANRPPDWRKTEWLPPAAPNTDVGYNSAASLNELRAGVKSWDDILLPQGRKAETVLRRKAEQRLLIKRIAKQLSEKDPDGLTITPEEIADEKLNPGVAATETAQRQTEELTQ